MAVIDYIAIIVVLVAIVLGALLGFGKLLKFFTGGIVGVIISVVVTYFFIGVVASWGFVQDIMAKLVGAMHDANNVFVNFLIKIGLEKIILAIALFIVIQILRIVIVNIIKGILEINNPVLIILNRVGGVVLLLAVAVMLALLVFHVVNLIGSGSEQNFLKALEGSIFRLDVVYHKNPLRFIVQKVLPNA